MPEAQSYFMGLDGFVWFVGVVEDRNDPDQLGRVRVRCLGFHTEDLVKLPTADLPWAHVMHPTTDPAMHGMGITPSFLVEGSWVVGFFRDAAEKQQPIVIGTLPGVPKSAADPTKGFNDPRNKSSTQLNDAGKTQYAKNPDYGPYPLDGTTFSRSSGHKIGESDTSRLARGETSETHAALKVRRILKETTIPTAVKPFLSTVEDGAAAETRGDWDEPNPKGIESDADPYASATYPYNHVYESEAVHIFEIDDTPGGERLNREHSSGTFEEIHPKGDKVVKVIGDNYEIIAGTSNVFIGAAKGSGDVLNLTVNGNVRELIKGDYIQEIEGDFTQNIGKNHKVKVGYIAGGNLEEEILGSHAFNIDEAVKGRIGADVDVIIEGSEVRSVNGFSSLHIEKTYAVNSNANLFITAADNINVATASGILSFKAASKLDMRSASTMKIKSQADIDMDSATITDITAGTGIDVNAITGDIDMDTNFPGIIELN